MNQLPVVVSAITLTVLLLLWINPSSRVVIIDLNYIKGQFIHQLALHHASNENVKKSNEIFNRKLKSVLDAYAKSHHVVIIDNNYVISSGQDITESIVPLLAAAMRGTP
jgi:hypothetical protein